MSVRLWVLLYGALAVASCSASSSVPNGTTHIDEDIVLERSGQSDTASREIQVQGAALLVAIVDENLSDVRLKLAGPGVEPVEVENHLAGTGTEIAALAVPRGERITVTVDGTHGAPRPGTVHLRLLQFARNAADDEHIGALVTGYEEWSTATAVRSRRDDIENVALPAIDRAIAALQQLQGDASLAAEALRVKANLYYYFQLDVGKAYEAASQSIAAYQKLGTSSASSLARAQLLQAFALCDLPDKPQMVAATRQMLEGLVEDRQRLARIERAHAMRALGVLERKARRLDYAEWRFDEAAAMYKSLGVPAPDEAATACGPVAAAPPT